MGVETLVKDLREQNTNLLTLTQHTIGAVTEIMGYYGSAASAITQVASLFMGGSQAAGQNTLTEIQNKLDDLYEAMKAGFNEVLAAVEAEGILARMRDLDQYIVPARSSVQLLLDFPVENPDPNTYPCNDYLRTALDAVGALCLEDKWSRVYYDSLYDRRLASNIGDPVDGAIRPYTEVLKDGAYTFTGTSLFWGAPKPATDTGDMIFSYTYVLPLYLEALLHLTVIVGGCVPDHLTSYKERYKEWAGILLAKHDQIEGYIRKLPLPIHTQASPGAYQDWSLHGRPWGAVEPYSASTSVGCWNALRPYGDPAGEIAEEVAALLPQSGTSVQEHAVRTIRRWRSVYAAIGLPAVWKATNNLLTLAGEPTLGPDHSTCSLRKLAHDALMAHRRREAAYGRRAPDEDISLRALAERLHLEGTVSMKRTVQM